MKKEFFNVTGMTCSACSARVEKAVKKINGTQNVAVNLLTNSMQLEFDENQTSTAAIIAAVTAAGYGASVKGEKNKESTEGGATKIREQEQKELKSRLIWSLVFLIPAFYVANHSMVLAWLGLPVPDIVRELFDGSENALTFAFTQFLLILPIMYLNRKFYIVGTKTLLQGAPNMDTLVGMGSMAAAAFGVFAIYRMGYGLGHGDMALVAEYSKNLYLESAGMIVTLITVGKYLEARAKGKTSRALEKLINLAPKQAAVRREGREIVIAAEDLKTGDTVIVRPGERIAADGVVIKGAASIDESAITGESIPVEKTVGARVIAATFSKNGYIEFRADKVGENSTISQIVKLVEEASATKAPIARLADKIAGIFVPLVLFIALIAGAVWLSLGASLEFAFSIAISILVISCPCSLGLATPVAIMVGMGRGAENGILIKSGEALEIAHNIDIVVMDKTGTITAGCPRVTDIKAIGMSEDELIAIAAGLEKASEHPLTEAIMTYAKEKNIAPREMTDFKAIFGRGVQAAGKNKIYLAGNARLMQENNIDLAKYTGHLNALADEGRTPLIFAGGRELIGIIGVADTEKETSKAAIESFKNMGIEVVMLTGDNERTATAIKRRLNIPQVIAGVLPQDKEKHIERLQAAGHKVAMIGDGINDAPALAKADIGIAIGAGTDIAIESADAVLMKNDLMDAVNAIKLSKAVILNIKENLFWAFFYNVICIPLAAGLFYHGWGLKLSPVMGAAAMSLSSVCVCLNALRLNFFKPQRAEIIAAAANKNNISAAAAVKGEEQTMEKTLKIEGMMCAHCQKHVHDALSKIAGVTEVNVDLEQKTAKVLATRDIAADEFKKVIVDAGYELVG